MRWLSLLALVLIASPAVGQDSEAEKLYRTMEKKIRTCKSAQFTFDADMGADGKAMKCKGSIRLATGDRMRIEMELDFFGKQMKMMMLTDGKTMYTKMDEQVQTQNKPDDNSVEMVNGFIARVGVASAFMLASRAVPPGEKKQPFDLDKEVPLKDFKLGAKEKVGDKNAQVVEYTVTVNGMDLKAKVWIDPQTSLPLKRSFAPDNNQGMQFVETYGTFTIDGRLDPKLFEIPK